MTGDAWITATPNPALGGIGFGVVEVTWDAIGRSGSVWVSQNGAAEQLVARGVSGTARVEWIQWPQAFAFRLRDSDDGELLAEVQVSRDPLEPRLAERTVVATVTEAEDPYARDTLLLFRSLRVFGGQMANCRAIAHVVERVDSSFRAALAELGVEVRVVSRVNGTHRTANKLRMLLDDPEADWLLAVDNDIVVVRDFAAMVFGEAFAGCPIDDFRYRRSDWAHYQELAGVSAQPTRMVPTRPVRGEIEVPLAFHGGVQLIPGRMVAAMGDAWLSGIERAPLDLAESPGDGWAPYMQQQILEDDQPSLTRAVLGLGVPWRLMPLSMNVPTHTPIHPAHDPEHLEPMLIHHHHRRDEVGRLLYGSHACLNRAIDRVNREFYP